MSKKKRNKERKASDSGPAGAEGPQSSAVPGKLPVIIALAGLAVLAFVLLTTESPQRSVAPIPTVTDLDRWRAAPVVDLALSPDRAMAKGPEDAPVTLVAFSDFECPYCKEANGVLEDVFERYSGEVRLVFKNYPLDMACNDNLERQVHLYACKAAAMARCAGAQDRFWDMHDAIFGLNALNTSSLDALPGELGLSLEDFETCVAAEETRQAIRADIDEGHQLGITGTPAVYLNGKRVPSFRPNGLLPIVEHVLSGDSDS